MASLLIVGGGLFLYTRPRRQNRLRWYINWDDAREFPDFKNESAIFACTLISKCSFKDHVFAKEA